MAFFAYQFTVDVPATAVSNFHHDTRVLKRLTPHEHHPGWRGLLSRLLFNRPGLWLLFTARKWLTRYHLQRQETV